MELKKSIAEQRKYMVLNTEQAKKIVSEYLKKELNDKYTNLTFGLPEIIDRYNVWNVPVRYNEQVVGYIVIDAYNATIKENLSSDKNVLLDRIQKIELNKNNIGRIPKVKKRRFVYKISELNNMVIKGDSRIALSKLPEQSIDMIFTSPPYYNAKKEYSEFNTYEDYLDFMRQVIRECSRVLMDGKFFIMNSSHVLVPRASRSESSTRIPVPFDLHQIFMEEGYEFIDDIIWQKPEGAGWATGRGRRFSADRNPMQYKAVPVTEYVMVYRKKPCVLIDNFIRKHPNQDIIKQSKIQDGYEKTNVWYISPAHDKRHPAIFPLELAKKVIQYYSFENDVVLDPFGGIGTTAKASIELNRRFCSIELNDKYIECTLNDLNKKISLLNGISFDYVDYSDLKNTKSSEKSLRYIINDLINEGMTESEIANILLHYSRL